MKTFIVKKSLLIAVSVIVLVGICLGIGAGVAVHTVASTAKNTPTIVIDAGHGGIDAGVRGVETGVKESNINLAIARYLQGYFVNAGFDCVMTRTSQGGLYGTYSKGFKMRDMTKRKQIIEENNADMVISVHQNFCPLPSKRGGIVFYDGENQSGKALALSIQQSLNDMEGAAKKSSPLVGDYYMLKCTANPSVIVECGFLSNKDDEKLLIEPEYQKSIAYAIFKGAVSFYS